MLMFLKMVELMTAQLASNANQLQCHFSHTKHFLSISPAHLRKMLIFLMDLSHFHDHPLFPS